MKPMELIETIKPITPMETIETITPMETIKPMETIIKITLDNYIRDYCSNFLSYLYPPIWKRTMFGIAKEAFIASSIPDKYSRILITNTGLITLTCYSGIDIMECSEFIDAEFKSCKLDSYLTFDDKVNIKTNWTVAIPLLDYPDRDEYFNDFGSIKIDDDKIILKYDSYDKGCRLKTTVKDIYFQQNISFDYSDENQSFILSIIKNEDFFPEKIILSVGILLAAVEILKYF